MGAHSSALLGENPQGIPNNLIPFIARLDNGELSELGVFWRDYSIVDGTRERDYIHIMDLADGDLATLKYLLKSQGYELFNLGAGVGYSVLEMIAVLMLSQPKIFL